MTKFKKIFFTCLFAYCYVMMALIIPTDYQVTAPGTIGSVSEDILIDNKTNTLDLYTISVYYKTKITPFEKMVFGLSQSMDTDKMSAYESSLTKKEESLQGQISKEASYQMSLIKAFELAKMKKTDIDFTSNFLGLKVYYSELEQRESLKIGTLIKSINGFNTYEEMINSIKKDKNYSFLLEDGTTVSFASGKKYLFYPYYSFESKTSNIDLKGLNTYTGGPSGGMMQTLHIYASLLNYEKINSKIVGTGTINNDGTIGKIGGATQKIYTANRYKANHFFMAKDNYDEELKVIEKFPNMKIYRIETIEQAVKILDEIYTKLH
ncbi:Ribosomal protein S5 domain 2-type fold [Alteracholeplasma palmae J233]|uniref:Ribosomal protein S5 domain 2-type fold n=1 Tax=Alteracholeplasma palmae (strain ATCC 49389 / J233) TaxID=1318466 RepID=U4KL09_ALTPJ|nr:S16 family serine protease [Alteracholeplasma palmae]CCV64539.1 Ribosomal protein S5 domain 2-type fold [Alteracholeplasma palmae J233]